MSISKSKEYQKTVGSILEVTVNEKPLIQDTFNLEEDINALVSNMEKTLKEVSDINKKLERTMKGKSYKKQAVELNESPSKSNFANRHVHEMKKENTPKL